MKTTKILGGIIAGVMACNMSYATEQEELCALDTDNFIYVAETDRCIPQNPCKDPAYENYCNRTFRNVVVSDYDGQEKDLVNLYAVSRDLDCLAQDVNFYENIVKCSGRGGVLFFEFLHINERKDVISKQNASSAIYRICKTIFGGEAYRDLENNNKFECKNANYQFCEKVSTKAWITYEFTKGIFFTGSNTQGKWCSFSIRD